MPTSRVSPARPDTVAGSLTAVGSVVVKRTREVPSTSPTTFTASATALAPGLDGSPTGVAFAAGVLGVLPAHEAVATSAAPAIRVVFHDVRMEISRCRGADLSGGYGRELSCVHGTGDRAAQGTFLRARRKLGASERAEREIHVQPVGELREVAARELLDPADPVANRVDVQVQPLGSAAPRSGALEERLEGLAQAGPGARVVVQHRLQHADRERAAHLVGHGGEQRDVRGDL